MRPEVARLVELGADVVRTHDVEGFGWTVMGDPAGNELDGVSYDAQAPAPAGPNLWTYVGVGFFAAAAGWFVLGRRR